MRKKKICLLIFLCMLFMAGTAASAAGRSTKALQAYEKVLRSASYDGMRTVCFALLDINQDGVKELLISNARNKVGVYGYDGKKVKRLYKHTTPVRGEFSAYYLDEKNYWEIDPDKISHCTFVGYLKSKKQLYFETNPTSESFGRWSVFLTMPSSASVKKIKIEFKLQYGGDPYKVYINGKRASKSEWGKYTDALGNVILPRTPVKFYKNTTYYRKACGIIASQGSGSGKNDKNAVLSRKAGTLYVGQSMRLSVSGNASKVKWSSSNKKVVTVSAAGVVKAKGKGKAVITARVGKRKLKCKVTVKSVLQVSPRTITVNKTGVVNVTFNYPTTACVSVKNSKYVSVSWEGGINRKSKIRIVGKKKGVTYLRITNKYNKEVITVKVKVTGVQKKTGSGNTGSGGTVAPVTPVTPVAPVTPAAPVQPAPVTPSVPEIQPSIWISGGSTGSASCTLYAHYTPQSVGISWTSSNPGVATVKNGVVTAKAGGQATITASITYNGRTYSASKRITVRENVAYGSWSAWSLDEAVGSANLEVRTTALYRYYYFYCPVCGGREPYQGKSDCGRYSLSLSDGHAGWFTVPYSESNSRTYSYSAAKSYTTSLGDGMIWNFTTAEKDVHTIGYYSWEALDTIIRRGYSTRRVYRSYTISSVY